MANSKFITIGTIDVAHPTDKFYFPRIYIYRIGFEHRDLAFRIKLFIR